jgi:hypothetical protein
VSAFGADIWVERRNGIAGFLFLQYLFDLTDSPLGVAGDLFALTFRLQVGVRSRPPRPNSLTIPFTS